MQSNIIINNNDLRNIYNIIYKMASIYEPSYFTDLPVPVPVETVSVIDLHKSTINFTERPVKPANFEADPSWMTSIIAHNDVEELFKYDQNRFDLFRIIAHDPKYYFKLISNYSVTREGDDIYLPDLLNIMSRKENRSLIIKFRINDNSSMIAVGYDSAPLDDEATYTEFRAYIENDMVRHHAFSETKVAIAHADSAFEIFDDDLETKIQELKEIDVKRRINRSGPEYEEELKERLFSPRIDVMNTSKLRTYLTKIGKLPKREIIIKSRAEDNERKRLIAEEASRVAKIAKTLRKQKERDNKVISHMRKASSENSSELITELSTMKDINLDGPFVTLISKLKRINKSDAYNQLMLLANTADHYEKHLIMTYIDKNMTKSCVDMSKRSFESS